MDLNFYLFLLCHLLAWILFIYRPQSVLRSQILYLTNYCILNIPGLSQNVLKFTDDFGGTLNDFRFSSFEQLQCYATDKKTWHLEY
jgi:hypothetical protein